MSTSASGGDLDSDTMTENSSECKAEDGSANSDTESEEDDPESSSYAMGYMPLSQDPDIDNQDDNCVVTNGDSDATECCTDDDAARHPKPVDDNCTPVPMSSIEDSK